MDEQEYFSPNLNNLFQNNFFSLSFKYCLYKDNQNKDIKMWNTKSPDILNSGLQKQEILRWWVAFINTYKTYISYAKPFQFAVILDASGHSAQGALKSVTGGESDRDNCWVRQKSPETRNIIAGNFVEIAATALSSRPIQLVSTFQSHSCNYSPGTWVSGLALNSNDLRPKSW